MKNKKIRWIDILIICGLNSINQDVSLLLSQLLSNIGGIYVFSASFLFLQLFWPNQIQWLWKKQTLLQFQSMRKYVWLVGHKIWLNPPFPRIFNSSLYFLSIYSSYLSERLSQFLSIYWLAYQVHGNSRKGFSWLQLDLWFKPFHWNGTCHIRCNRTRERCYKNVLGSHQVVLCHLDFGKRMTH